MGKRKCNEEKCIKQPTYGFKNTTKRLYCKDHKKENMIDVTNKKCLKDNCNKQPTFNLSNEKNAMYCSEHKLYNMINIRSKRCKEQNCNKIPSFNLPDQKNGLYCNLHKKDNMIDVKHKCCLEENCNLRPSFNLPNKNAIYCSEHKKDNMIDVCHKKCLECNKIPSFNFQNNKNGIYCNIHKKDYMVDVTNNKCISVNCETIVRYKRKYNGYCLRCFINLFPNAKNSKNYKIKEQHVVDFIKENFTQHFIFDKSVDGACSRKRPDAYLDLFTHVIVIECDENQHKYGYSCENKRMMLLFNDFGNRPIVFIRLNPDSYINHYNKKIQSCFKYHNFSQVPVVKNKKEWLNRLNELKIKISKYIKNIPNKEITEEYLFFDSKF